ncbi:MULTISPECIES: endonuclease domain-containing protein [Streptomyces]|uniref:endonuclease domain-containing protein n=1 Tax=Streptomyces TaxID=1883 RepID=UPI00167E8CB9|nr:endonuclease domain-containing protein [Streptomyces glebosus]
MHHGTVRHSGGNAVHRKPVRRPRWVSPGRRDDQGAAGLRPIRPEPGPGHVDHTPDTGKVRGVRCINCNSALGKLRDDPVAMRRAIAYPEGNVWKPILEAPGVYQLPS